MLENKTKSPASALSLKQTKPASHCRSRKTQVGFQICGNIQQCTTLPTLFGETMDWNCMGGHTIGSIEKIVKEYQDVEQ